MITLGTLVTRVSFDSQPWNWDWRFYPQELWEVIVIGKNSYVNRWFWLIESRVYFLMWSWVMPIFKPHSPCQTSIHAVPLMFFLRLHSLLIPLLLVKARCSGGEQANQTSDTFGFAWRSIHTNILCLTGAGLGFVESIQCIICWQTRTKPFSKVTIIFLMKKRVQANINTLQ